MKYRIRTDAYNWILLRPLDPKKAPKHIKKAGKPKRPKAQWKEIGFYPSRKHLIHDLCAESLRCKLPQTEADTLRPQIDWLTKATEALTNQLERLVSEIPANKPVDVQVEVNLP